MTLVTHLNVLLQNHDTQAKQAKSKEKKMLLESYEEETKKDPKDFFQACRRWIFLITFLSVYQSHPATPVVLKQILSMFATQVSTKTKEKPLASGNAMTEARRLFIRVCIRYAAICEKEMTLWHGMQVIIRLMKTGSMKHHYAALHAKNHDMRPGKVM